MELIVTREPQHIFSGNPLLYQWAIHPWNSSMANLNIYAIVSIEISGAVVLKTTKIFPDENGLLTLDISSVADAQLRYFTPPPDLDRPLNATGQYDTVYVRPTLWNGEQQFTLTGSPDKGVALIKGGFQYEYTPPNDTYISSPTSNPVVKPLMNLNEKERVFKEDIFFSGFVVGNVANNRKINYVIRYLLGDNYLEATGTKFASFTPAANGVILFPAGYDQLGLQSLLPSGAIPIEYDLIVVQIVPITGDVTEITSTFKIDHRKFYNTKQLLYRNSLGGLQPLRLMGDIDFEAEYKGDVVNTVPPPSYIVQKNLLPAQARPWPEEQLKFSGNTGFLDQFEADRIRDFFLSREVYEVKDNRLVPVVVNKNSAKFYSNNDALIAIDIEWRPAFINHHYSPVILPANTCPKPLSLAWRQSGDDQITVFWQLPFGFDYARVKITFVFDSSVQTFFVEGNSGSARIDFTRPGWATTATNIVVSIETCCGRYLAAPSYSDVLALTASSLAPEFSIVALDDRYALAKGYTTGVSMPNALLNDYDPDGGAIEALPDTGATNDGGYFEIETDGSVTYTPPSASYTGTDYFDYEAKRTGGGITATARYYIVVY